MKKSIIILLFLMGGCTATFTQEATNQLMLESFEIGYMAGANDAKANSIKPTQRSNEYREFIEFLTEKSEEK